MCVGLAIGALWEVAEYFFIVPDGSMTLHDTITDLVVDTAGALAGAVLEYWGLQQVRGAV